MFARPYSSRQTGQDNRHFYMPARKHRSLFLWLAGLLLFFAAGLVHAQPLVAVDDSFGVPFGQPLLVEAEGVLKNDTFGGDPVSDFAVTADLVDGGGPSFGFLTCLPPGVGTGLCTDGSFKYTPLSGFSGTDSFTYRVTIGENFETAIVTLTACTDEGAGIFSCWNESLYRAKLTALGHDTFLESFEGAVWGSVRSTVDTTISAPSITSQGIVWTTNHPDDTEITTGSGPALSGSWGGYDASHGFAEGLADPDCDPNLEPDPVPAKCLYHDGLSGTMATLPGGNSLYGAGGYITGDPGDSIAIILYGRNAASGTTAQVNIGKLPDAGHHFLGLIDTTASGFTGFEFQEQDGKVGQPRLIFGDDFIFSTISGAPVADPNGPYTGTAGSPVSFDGTGSFDPDGGTIVAYDWDFGDGTVVLGAGATPSHTYATADTFFVTLTVTDNDGASSATVITTATIVAGGSDFTIGGMVSGLAGTGLELQINAGEILGIGADGVFTFATPLADSSDYTVTVLTQPGDPTQSCGVTDGNGTLNGADITDVVVTCVTPGEEIIFADGFED